MLPRRSAAEQSRRAPRARLRTVYRPRTWELAAGRPRGGAPCLERQATALHRERQAAATALRKDRQANPARGPAPRPGTRGGTAAQPSDGPTAGRPSARPQGADGSSSKRENRERCSAAQAGESREPGPLNPDWKLDLGSSGTRGLQWLVDRSTKLGMNITALTLEDY